MSESNFPVPHAVHQARDPTVSGESMVRLANRGFTTLQTCVAEQKSEGWAPLYEVESIHHDNLVLSRDKGVTRASSLGSG